jgi:chromosome partitioning protein
MGEPPYGRCSRVLARLHRGGVETVRVVSVINYKGGVGKTTLTSNLGAYLAQRGKRILLVDLDPQSSLTYSFFAPDSVNRPRSTLKEWFNSFVDGVPQRRLSEFVAVPSSVNDAVSDRGGFVGLIPSHLELIDVDRTLLVNAGMRNALADAHIFRVRRALLEALTDPALGSYDFALIDCPPNFNIITQSGIAASDHLLVPTSPDYLSSLGTGTLLTSAERFVSEFNQQAMDHGSRNPMAPTPLGVVFTKVEYRLGHPIAPHQYYMEQVRKSVGDVPIFAATLRHNAAFGKENPHGVPVILRLRPTDKVYVEMMSLATEFLNRADTAKKDAPRRKRAVA